MSLCIGIRENQLCEVLETLGENKSKFKFKCLYNSENYYEYYNKQLGLDTLRDALVFSGCGKGLAAIRTKVRGTDAEINMTTLMNNIFEDDRQIAIVNDFFDHQNIILVFTNRYKNPAERKGEVKITFTDDELDNLIERFLKELNYREGVPTSTWNEYKFRTKTEDMYDMTSFIFRQQIIDKEIKDSYRRQIIKHFEESFKYRLITIYTKLRDYNLEEIMRILDGYGYLDDRFKTDGVFIYEEEARRILARRLCTKSFKNDIEVLINKDIISRELIEYEI